MDFKTKREALFFVCGYKTAYDELISAFSKALASHDNACDPNKTCRTCRWRSDEFTSACTNGDSINRADFVDAGDTCDEWEGIE